MNCSPPGSSIHGILQARRLEWVAISVSRGSSWPRDRNQVSWTAGRFFKQRQRNTQNFRQGGLFPYKVKSPAQTVRTLKKKKKIYLTALGLSCGMQDLSCGMWDLVPWPGIRLGPPALEARSFRHRTTREVPVWALYLSAKKCSRPKAQWVRASKDCLWGCPPTN